MEGVRRAKKQVQKAMKHLKDSEERLWAASGYMKGTPEEHRIISLALGLERLKEFVEEQEGRLE